MINTKLLDSLVHRIIARMTERYQNGDLTTENVDTEAAVAVVTAGIICGGMDVLVAEYGFTREQAVTWAFATKARSGEYINEIQERAKEIDKGK